MSMKDLLCFSAGLGIGIGISVLVAPCQGVATRKLLRRRRLASHHAAPADQAAEDYASDSATEEGMAEGPLQLRR
jgi:hypothetical protein